MDTRNIVNCHRCLSLLCLMPYSPHKRQQLVQKIYTSLLLITILVIAVYGFYNVQGNESDLVISLSVSALVFLSQTCTSTFVYCEMLTTYDQHVEFVNRTRCIYDTFSLLTSVSGCGDIHGKSGCSSGKCQKYACIAVALGGSILTYMCFASFKNYYGFFWYSLPAVAILHTRFMQISICVDIIRDHVKALNAHLQEMLRMKRLKSLILLNADCCAAESLQRLLTLKDIYTDIFAIGELFNEMFGWSIVSVVVCIFLDLTLHLYWGILTSDGFYRQYYLYMIGAVLVSLSLVLVVFCYNCEQLQSSLSRTKSLVKQLIDITDSPEYSAVVYEFSLQIYSKPLYITAKEFFRADFKLLLALAIQVVSMIVILVQFSLMEFGKRGYFQS